ncbi:MAG TPA: hypothetical protein VF103_00210, partial [Polyangiaceae bacterium]
RARLTRVPWLHASFERVVVFHLVAFAWIFFRADTFGDAWTLLGNASHLDWSWDSLVVPAMSGYELVIGVVAVMLLSVLHAWQDRPNSGDFLAQLRTPARFALLYAMIAAIALFGEFNLTEFIYFQF